MSLTPKKLNRDGNIVTRVITAPASEPITVSEVKNYARIDYSDDDTLIGTYIEAVRDATEGYLGRALITQTIEAYLDYVPTCNIVLPKRPLITINSMYARDFDGTTVAITTDSYYVSNLLDPATITFHETTLPTTDRDKGGYVINYDAGYGPNASDVPAAIRLGMMQWVLETYENRIIDRTPPADAKKYLSRYRDPRLLL